MQVPLDKGIYQMRMHVYEDACFNMESFKKKERKKKLPELIFKNLCSYVFTLVGRSEGYLLSTFE